MQEYKSYDAPMPETDEEAMTWIPDNETAHNYYYCQRALGLTVIQAVLATCAAYLGIEVAS